MRLAEALRPLAPRLALGPALADFESALDAEVTARVLARLGLAPNGDTDAALVAAAYAFLEDSGIGYDRFFFDLHGGLGARRLARSRRGRAPLHRPARGMRSARCSPSTNRPATRRAAAPRTSAATRPCSLLIDEIESIWSAIARSDDWTPFEAKVREIREMGAALAPRAG